MKNLKTPKKKARDQNGKLKSALKNSPSNNRDAKSQVKTIREKSDAEKPKSKKSERNISKDKSSSENEQVTDDEPVMNVADVDENVDKNIDESKKLENKDEQMVAIIMDKLKNSEEKKISEDDGSDSEEEGNEKSKKRRMERRKRIINLMMKTIKREDEEKSSKGEHSDSSGEKDKPDKNKDKDVEDKKITDNENKSEDDKEKSDSDNSSNDEKKKSKKKWRSDKLLTTKIDSTDSEEEFSKYCKKKEKPREEIMRKVKKRGKKAIVLSDSEDSHSDKKASEEDSDDESEKSDDEKSSSGNEREKNEEKKKRKRIKRTRDSSSSDDDKSTRKQIRRLIGKDSLSETTKQAEAEEKERKARIIEKQKKYNKFFEAKSDSKVEKVILDFDEKKNKELLSVHKGLVKKLKPHQASGVQFMWDACFESLERTKSTKGSGCILAHCMGLGKTLQVIALSHTLLINGEQTGVTKIMVVCPLNTVLNWKAEFKKWLPKEDLEIYELVSCKQNYERQYIVQEWHRDGGVLIIGYHMFRNLSNPDNKRISKKMRTTFQEGFLDPARRIVLTGTPLQNNLKEYWCMVQFIKPNLLGTYKEYLNRFVNPIINGQYTDSTQHDILLMRKRSHVLHKLLDGVVQRRDYAVLEPYLPPKFEYVLFIALTETQNLQRMCTHPRVLLDKTVRKEKEFDTDSEGSLKDFIDDDGESSDSSSNSSSSKSNSGSEDSDKDKKGKKSKSQQKIRVTRAQAAQRKENNEESDPEIEEVKKEWWQEYCDGEELDNINNSGKLFLLLDGSSSCDNRASWCDMFNNPNNIRARLFLISTKAGGLGINLVAANRVIIFDVSWNPSHDIQSIYRVYRFGQTKPCYIYRFVAYGTMEMKIYERQVTKQAISKRVIDEQQIDRHYNQNDLQELYRCDLEPTERPIPLVPKDVLLGEMLQKYEKTIFKYHLHQSLLENKEAEGLNEEERKDAWEEFENEKVLRKNTNPGLPGFNNSFMNAYAIEAALASIVRKDNPSWSEVQIKGIIPALMYIRVQQEMQIMQALHAQK
ncbi:hypothetical protein NQ314_011041 [Rhamnusium bicolor]|uniref:Transcriptional regulator ATRX homolog n=1 Tax=Rhamnusium bicolor TaxID=1586634 RepID=A0AAV8XM44_9CUCU|nr:hypothetical protein NQ314_011041 [Rhamnusium bicolor]